MAMAFLVCNSYTPAEAQTARTITGRIAFSTDGNVPGTNDMAGTPLAIALLDKAQQSGKIVYVDYANHYWNNTTGSTYNNYKSSIESAFTRFGINNNKLFDVSRNRTAARTALVAEINRSTSSNPLRIILNGPAAHVCDAIQRSNSAARRYVTVYTHGRTDAEASVNGSCNMAGIRQIKPSTVNHTAYTPYGSLEEVAFSNFNWLRDHSDANIRWIYARLQNVNTSRATITDVGSTYELLTGDSSPTPTKLSNLLRSSNTPVEPEPEPQPNNPGQLGQLLSDSCYAKIWDPAESTMGSSQWYPQRAAKATHAASFDSRASYVSNAPGGVGAVRFVSYGDKWNSLLDFRAGNVQSSMPAQGMEEARFVVKYYIPNDYNVWVAGRMAAGLKIGNPNGRISCHSGGCPPENQQGSSVRVNFSSSLRLMVYSYHLNRTSPRITDWDNPLTGGVVPVRQFGAGPRTTVAMPKGEWVTFVLDVKLNTVGQSNGSARLLLYNERGSLLSSALLQNSRYRDSASWKIVGPYMTEKYDNLAPGPKTQYMYARDYAIYNKRANCQ